MAYDERRHNFLLSRQKCEEPNATNLVETWFRGIHSDIGGTYTANELERNKKARTAISLHWMCQQAKKANVKLSSKLVNDAKNRIRPLSRIGVNKDPIREARDESRTPHDGDFFHKIAKNSAMGEGEIRSIRCHSRVPFNPSGILVQTGQRFSFEVNPNQKWKDKKIDCNANGWIADEQFNFIKAWGFERSEPFRRMKDENWFKLIGVIEDMDDEDDVQIEKQRAFAIGTQLDEYSANANGEIYTYANDIKQYGLLDLYTNNTGFVDIKVTRLA